VSSATVRQPVGTVNVVDLNPLNWLFITWNTAEEPVRTDPEGHLIGAAMEAWRWVEETTLEVKLREGVQFQDGEPLTARSFERAFIEVQRWVAPHPPGTWLNFDPRTRCEIVDDQLVRMHFPEPDGLVLGKFRGFHIMSSRFWRDLGFGYDRTSSGEGHW
jgi:ABC-type transport system substrate-binding protein